MEECKKGKAAGTSTIRCKKPPVTVTREGGVSAPDWRREDAMPQKGAEREGVSEGEWESEKELKKVAL